jgi:hypothetical protein
MIKLRGLTGGSFVGLVALTMGLAVTGCGGETTQTKPATEPQQAAATPTPPSKSAKSAKKLRGLAEGGDMTAREKRAARQNAGKPAAE